MLWCQIAVGRCGGRFWHFRPRWITPLLRTPTAKSQTPWLMHMSPACCNTSRLITVRDGELEKTLSNDILPYTGITVADVDSGKFNELLPDTPDNAFVWFLYYQRIGQENVQKGLIERRIRRASLPRSTHRPAIRFFLISTPGQTRSPRRRFLIFLRFPTERPGGFRPMLLR